MAYSYNGNNMMISTGSTPVTTEPITIHALSNNISTTNAVILCAIAKSTSARVENLFAVNAGGSTQGYKALADKGVYNATWAEDAVLSTSTFSSQTWNSFLAVFASTTSRIAYLNGGGKNSSSVSIANNVSPDSIQVGAVLKPPSTYYNALNGLIAEVAIWNVALTDAEIVSLAKGFKPFRIRPQSLVFYAPLVRTLADRKSGITLTPVNSPTVADHPRAY